MTARLQILGRIRLPQCSMLFRNLKQSVPEKEPLLSVLNIWTTAGFDVYLLKRCQANSKLWICWLISWLSLILILSQVGKFSEVPGGMLTVGLRFTVCSSFVSYFTTSNGIRFGVFGSHLPSSYKANRKRSWPMGLSSCFDNQDYRTPCSQRLENNAVRTKSGELHTGECCISCPSSKVSVKLLGWLHSANEVCERIPHFSQSTLAKWYQSPVSAHSTAILQYFHKRTLMVLEILNEVEFVTKTA